MLRHALPQDHIRGQRKEVRQQRGIALAHGGHGIARIPAPSGSWNAIGARDLPAIEAIGGAAHQRGQLPFETITTGEKSLRGPFMFTVRAVLLCAIASRTMFS